MRDRTLKDYAGMRFGKLVAVRMVERGVRPENNHRWLFNCDCGQKSEVGIKSVRSGHTSSCGCLQRASVVQRNQVHGLSQNHRREYRSWKDMRGRCNNPGNQDYPDYGGRGIAVDARWNDFAVFFGDMGIRPEGHTIDRIDVNGMYEPGNCRWAAAKQQANNKRSNRTIEFNGEAKTLQQWCDQFGMEPSKVRYRLGVGYSVAEAFDRGDKRSAGNSPRH